MLGRYRVGVDNPGALPGVGSPQDRQNGSGAGFRRDDGRGQLDPKTAVIPDLPTRRYEPASGLLDDGSVRSSARRIGLEQEFFLVDASGEISDLGDVLLGACWESARAEGVDPGCFKAECVHSLVEVTTPPSAGFSPLVENYVTNLNLALDAAAGLGLRLYPLGTYPLPTSPTARDDPRYRLKARTIGYERFLNAGRCAGVHLHIEAPPGTIWPHVKVAHTAPAAAREEMLDLYNLATALDPALVAISRACPFYEGRMSGLAARTVHYRGGFGPEGVYTKIQEVGALGPYSATVENLEAEERERYVAWYRAMDLAGVERSLFSLTGANVHRASWNPVRLNRHGTVEIRTMDSNYPQITLAVCAVVCGAFDRVRYEHLRVKPMPGVRTLKSDGSTLLVPDFAYLSETLLRAAVSAGVEDPDVEAYLGSLLRFAAPYVEEPEQVGLLLGADGGYSTTEAEIRRRMPGAMPSIPRAEGLRMVQESCRLLEEQVHTLCRRRRGELREIAPHFGGETGGEHRRAARSTANGPSSAALGGGGEPSADSPGPLVMLPARDVRARRLEKEGA